MRCPEGYELFKENWLVRRFMNSTFRSGRFLISHGKRVGKDCPLTYEERRAYVLHGAAKCAKMVMERKGCTLRAAIETIKEATGGDL